MTPDTMPALLELLRQMEPPEALRYSIAGPFVRCVQISPAMMERIQKAAPGDRRVGPGATLYGIQIERNVALPDHYAVVRFGDGRVGLWNINESQMNVFKPLDLYAGPGPEAFKP